MHDAVMRHAAAAVLAFTILLTTKAAWASFHLIYVTEVFPGTTAAPNAQYIQLQAYTTGQTQTSGHTVRIFDASGTMVANGSIALSNVTNSTTILIGTTEAATLFTVTQDFTMMPVLPLAGGKVCFDTIDCVSWGSYNATDVGTPAYQALGLRKGQALRRRFDISGGSTTLDAGDDTNNSANDWRYGAPTPKNNLAVAGTPPASTCGNNTVQGLEQCDDNNTTSNDGCSSTCTTEACGDGIVQTSEQCDDTNLSNTDACSTTCVLQVPAVDGAPDAGATVDAPPGAGADAGNNNETGDGGGCCQSNAPGSAPYLALGVLGLLVRRRRRAPRAKRNTAN